MAEFQPPRHGVHPLRVIFMISRDAPPALAEPDAWSAAFGSFVSSLLQKSARLRPSAAEALRCSFIQSTAASADCLASEVAGAQRWLAERRLRAAAIPEEPASPGAPDVPAEAEPPPPEPPQADAVDGSVGSGSLDAHELSSEEDGRSPAASSPAAAPLPPRPLGSVRAPPPPLLGCWWETAAVPGSPGAAAVGGSASAAWLGEAAAVRAWSEAALEGVPPATADRLLALGGGGAQRPLVRLAALRLAALLPPGGRAKPPATAAAAAWDWGGEAEAGGAEEASGDWEAAVAEALARRPRAGLSQHGEALAMLQRRGGAAAPPALRSALQGSPPARALAHAMLERVGAARGALACGRVAAAEAAAASAAALAAALSCVASGD